MKERKLPAGFTGYSTTVLGLLTFAYIAEECTHFMIGSISRDMAQDIHFGDLKCYDEDIDADTECDQYTTQTSCEAVNANYTAVNETGICYWDYSGQGIEYQVLAGTIFVVMFTVSGVVMGYLGDKVNRPILIGSMTALFSVLGCLMGLAQEYWHLVILRIGIAAS